MLPIHAGRFLALLLLIAPVATADTIVYADGSTKPVTNVKVTDETLKEVQYLLPRIRQQQVIDAAKVVEVQYADTPTEFTLAQENFAAGAYLAAAPQFGSAARDSDGRKGFEVLCAYMEAEALRRGGKLDDAVSAFVQLQKSHANSRYVPQAILGRALALVQKNDQAGARKAFQEVRAFGGRWELESELQIQMLDESKNPAAALDVYKRLAQSAGRTHPGVANQAKLRIGRVLIAQQKFDEARTFFQAVIDERTESTPREVVAGAFNGLGAAMWNKPGASADDLRTALFHHLRVIVSYTDVDAEQAEAYYSAGVLFSVVEWEEGQARSRQYLNRCVSEYGDTAWGRLANAGIPAVLARDK